MGGALGCDCLSADGARAAPRAAPRWPAGASWSASSKALRSSSARRLTRTEEAALRPAGAAWAAPSTPALPGLARARVRLALAMDVQAERAHFEQDLETYVATMVGLGTGATWAEGGLSVERVVEEDAAQRGVVAVEMDVRGVEPAVLEEALHPATISRLGPLEDKASQAIADAVVRAATVEKLNPAAEPPAAGPVSAEWLASQHALLEGAAAEGSDQVLAAAVGEVSEQLEMLERSGNAGTGSVPHRRRLAYE